MNTAPNRRLALAEYVLGALWMRRNTRNHDHHRYNRSGGRWARLHRRGKLRCFRITLDADSKSPSQSRRTGLHAEDAELGLLRWSVEGCAETQTKHLACVERVDDSIIPESTSIESSFSVESPYCFEPSRGEVWMALAFV